jgi:hypothetical protein
VEDGNGREKGWGDRSDGDMGGVTNGEKGGVWDLETKKKEREQVAMGLTKS